MNKCGIKASRNEDEKDASFDIQAKVDRKKFTIEVKYDSMAQKTNNIAIEVWNTKKDEPSGLNITEADLWIHCLNDDTNITVWAIKVDRLKEVVKEMKPLKVVENSFRGDSNAKLFIYTIDSIIQEFVRLDNISNEQVKKEVKRLVK